MKILSYIIAGLSLLFFLFGITLKWLNLNGSSELLFFTPIPLVVMALIYLMRFHKTDSFQAVFYLLGSFITVYLAWRLLFFSYSKIVFAVCVALLIAGIYLLIAKKEKARFFQMVCFAYALVMLFVATLSHSRVYAWAHLQNASYYGLYGRWDKQSYYLYQEGRFDEALEANHKAQEAYDHADRSVLQEGDFEKLAQHAELIKSKTWMEYDVVGWGAY